MNLCRIVILVVAATTSGFARPAKGATSSVAQKRVPSIVVKNALETVQGVQVHKKGGKGYFTVEQPTFNGQGLTVTLKNGTLKGKRVSMDDLLAHYDLDGKFEKTFSILHAAHRDKSETPLIDSTILDALGIDTTQKPAVNKGRWQNVQSPEELSTGMMVKTKKELQATRGMLIGEKNLLTRKPGALGIVDDLYGEIFWVDHNAFGSPSKKGFTAAYYYDDLLKKVVSAK